MFEALDTNDFEHVIKTLKDASLAIPIYDLRLTDTADKMKEDAKHLKNILIQTIAKNHPEIPNEISDNQFQSCRQFLSHFLGPENKNGKVYTLNYDLLLYWTLMNSRGDFNDPIDLKSNDGFGREEDTNPDYVTWMGESSARDQSVHYLHGALHLFDEGTELQKYTWVNTGKHLLDQAREAMENNKFPLFVAEGQSKDKLTKIKHSAYLYHSYKSFAAQMEKRNDALFIFGHKLAKNDLHILDKIERGKIKQVYVSLYGDLTNEENEKMIATAKRLNQDRAEQYPLKVAFYDAASTKVWENYVEVSADFLPN